MGRETAHETGSQQMSTRDESPTVTAAARVAAITVICLALALIVLAAVNPPL